MSGWFSEIRMWSMAAIVFDVRKAERRLLDAGASQELAEATADLMSEAVVHNLDTLVTKDYLDHVLDARFAQQDARIDQRFHELETRLQEWRDEFRGELRLIHVLQALLIAGVFLPQIRTFLG
jgi:hypothetical protein